MSEIIITTKEELKKLLEDTFNNIISVKLDEIKSDIQNRYITANEAANLLGVTFNTFKTFVADGTIKAHYPSATGHPKYLLSEILKNYEVKRSKNTGKNTNQNH